MIISFIWEQQGLGFSVCCQKCFETRGYFFLLLALNVSLLENFWITITDVKCLKYPFLIRSKAIIKIGKQQYLRQNEPIQRSYFALKVLLFFSGFFNLFVCEIQVWKLHVLSLKKKKGGGWEGDLQVLFKKSERIIVMV